MTSLLQRKLNGLLRTERLGKVIHYQDEMDSTNTALLELGEKGASEGTVVITDRQTGGRGRLDRKWISPKGVNLYISILFRPEIAAFDSPLFTLIAAIALNRVIQNSCAQETKIKWPNDIQISGKKVAGILTEMRSKREMVDFIVVGIGVNINMDREYMNQEMGKVAYIATSIKEHTGKEINRSKFAADLLLELENCYQLFLDKGKAPILSHWTEMWGDLNKRVLVNLEDCTYEGTAVGIDDKGYLIVENEVGEVNTVISGDVRVI